MKYAPPRIRTAGPRIAAIDTAGGAFRAHYRTSDHVAWAKAVKARDNYHCVRCGAGGDGVRLYADHVVELADGGAKLDVANGQTLCAPCHAAKTQRAKAARVVR